jgi:Secretion system C-terminal sorting domain
MRYALCILGLFAGTITGTAQLKLSENFDASLAVPQGWGVWNSAPVEADPATLWTVTDTSDTNTAVGIDGLPVAHSGSHAIGVSWLSGLDTNTNDGAQTDAWLITKRISGIAQGDSLVFWGSGGAPAYLDSLQLWISIGDSTPATQSFQLGTIVWPVGTPYGVFQRYAFDVSGASGLDAWIGFRYFQDITLDGFYVYIDDVTVGQQSTAVAGNRVALPSHLELHQNYPNPFNPSTTIEFVVPGAGQTTLKIYDALGREVVTLIDNVLSGGTYRTTWSAGNEASGVYFCRLQSGGSVDTRKLLLMR